MSRQRKSSSARDETRQRNRVRGMIAAARDRTLDGQLAKAATQFRTHFRETLMSARSSIRPEKYDEYLAWLIRQIDTQVPASIRRRSAGYDYLNGIINSSPLLLEHEFKWVAARLAAAADEITRFRRLADELEEAFWADDQRRFRAIGKVIVWFYGQTLWLIELRTATAQLIGGLEAQKHYAEAVKSTWRRGILSYLTHYVSARAEPNVTPSRYTEEVTGRIDRSLFAKDIKIYLKRRLAGIWPVTRSGLSTILRIEQSHSNIDLYETFVAIAHHVLTDTTEPTLRNCLRDALARLDAIQDWRLDKMALMLGDLRHVALLPARAPRGQDLLLNGDPLNAYKAAMRCLRTHPRDVAQGCTAGYARASFAPRKRLRNHPPWAFVIDRLTVLFSKNGDFDKAFAELSKFSRNFSSLSTARVLHALCLSEGVGHSTLDPNQLRTLNSPYLDPDDLTTIPEQLITSFDALFQNSASASLDFARIIRTNGNGSSSMLTVVANYAKALHFRKVGEYRKAYIELQPNLESCPPPLAMLSARLAAENLTLAGDLGGAIDIIARLASSNIQSSSVLPVANLLKDVEWNDVEPFADRLGVSIVLDLHWRTNSDDQVATLRRFAFDEFLTRNGVAKPTDLAASLARYPPEQFIYFLRYLCVPSVMDMCLSFRNSRDLEEERRRVCGLLCELDPVNSDTYQAELFEITNRLSIQDGLRIVDSSRLYVDIDGLSAWAEKELKETFARYHDLVRAGIGVSDDFETVLRNIHRKDQSAKQLFSVPDNEADDLLVGMVSLLRDQFLFNTSHGLDSYLSKRVRHGSVPNHLRSPVEKAALITQREAGTDSYKRNEYWERKLWVLPSDETAEVLNCLVSFAQEFDAIILDLKDALLQITSPEHPRGLFSINLTPPIYHIIRSAAQEDFTFEGFLRTCYAIFWGVLANSLEATRSHLRTTAKAQLAQAFDKLRSSVVVAAGTHPELSMSIGDTSAEVQRRVEAIAEWFNKPESRQGAHTYSLREAINIAVASALDALRAFRPAITVEATSEHNLPAHGLVIFAEIIWVALENVRRHSGVESGPKVSISGAIDIENELLLLCIRNEVRPGIRGHSVETKLSSIRAIISDGSFKERVRKEGNSGFLKIASVVSQSDRGRVHFFFASDSEFCLEVDVPLVVYDK